VKHDLKESVEVFVGRNLDPTDVTDRVNDGLPSTTGVTNQLNYPSQT
jgi:hypothetical protein